MKLRFPNRKSPVEGVVPGGDVVNCLPILLVKRVIPPGRRENRPPRPDKSGWSPDLNAVPTRRER